MKTAILRIQQAFALAVMAGGAILVLGGAVIAAAKAYPTADANGYISHTVETYIQVPGDWINGEVLPCRTNTTTEDSNLGSAGYAFFGVDCGSEPFKDSHLMRVSFYGRKIQSEHFQVLWNCTRENDGFTCRETGGLTVDEWKEADTARRAQIVETMNSAAKTQALLRDGAHLSPK